MIYMHWVPKGILCGGFKGVQEEIPSEEARTFQIGSVAFPLGQCTSPQLYPCRRLFDQDEHQDSSSFKEYIRGCRYETIEGVKEGVTKVIDKLTQEDFHGALQKMLERQNKCIAAGGDYFEWDKSFMCVLSIKVPIRKKSGNLFDDPRNLNALIMVKKSGTFNTGKYFYI